MESSTCQQLLTLHRTFASMETDEEERQVEDDSCSREKWLEASKIFEKLATSDGVDGRVFLEFQGDCSQVFGLILVVAPRKGKSYDDSSRKGLMPNDPTRRAIHLSANDAFTQVSEEGELANVCADVCRGDSM